MEVDLWILLWGTIGLVILVVQDDSLEMEMLEAQREVEEDDRWQQREGWMR